VTDLLTKRSAIISDCGLYRYRLDRGLATGIPELTAAVIMVNPSTADADIDDHTIRKLYGFAERFGASRIIVGNLFAFRATDVSEVSLAADPVGPENDRHLADIFTESKMTILAWGASSKLPPRLRGRWRKVIGIAQGVGNKGFWCLGTAKDGHPLHPLTLGYDRPLIDWRPPS
jgi:hypothetical protein